MKKPHGAAIFAIIGSLVLGVVCICYFYFVQRRITDTDENTAHIREVLKSLPYITYVEEERNSEKEGVTLYNDRKAYPGVTMILSAPPTRLIDMRGQVLHEWDFEAYFARLNPNAELVAITGKRTMLAKLDWRSNILWKHEVSAEQYAFEHEVSFDQNGNIYTLLCEKIMIEHASYKFPLKEENILVVSPQGKIKQKISLWNLFKDMVPQEYWDQIITNILEKNFEIKDLGYEVLSTNAIEVIDRDIGIGKQGDLLICVRNLSIIAIIRPSTEKVVWMWEKGRKVLSECHNPTLLDNGNILIFENNARIDNVRYSRILELNPYTEEIVWEYKSDPPETFHSKNQGGAQRLPNGNTLIAESKKGHVFEVTPEGETVWEFWNPDLNKKGKRKTLYRCPRILKDDLKKINFPPEFKEKLRVRGYL